MTSYCNPMTVPGLSPWHELTAYSHIWEKRPARLRIFLLSGPLAWHLIPSGAVVATAGVGTTALPPGEIWVAIVGEHGTGCKQ